MSFNFLLTPDVLDATIEEVPDLHQILDSTLTEPWVGYPLGAKVVKWRSSEVMFQRTYMTQFLCELVRLGNRWHTPEQAQGCLHDARSLATALYRWHDDLPADLQYSPRLPMGILEMQ